MSQIDKSESTCPEVAEKGDTPMQKTYTWSELGVEMNKHPILVEAREIERAFSQIGWEVELVDFLRAESGTPAKMDLLVTPDLSRAVEMTVENVDWLSVNRDIAETYADDPDGNVELSNVVVRNDIETAEIVEMMSDSEYSSEDSTDMLTKLRHMVDCVARPEDPRPEVVVAYDIMRKSLGWKAERLLDRTDDFYKELASLDQKGVDLGTTKASPWSLGSDDLGFQLKTMQRVTSKGLHRQENEHPHLSYAWTSEGINVADMEERRGSDGQSKKVANDLGTTGTVVKKSQQGGTTKDLGRSARVLGKE
jgi:hypothetical protein